MVGVAATRATPGQTVLVTLAGFTPDPNVAVVLGSVQEWMTADELVQPGDWLERVDWWEDRAELAAVMAMVHDADGFGGISDAVYFVHRPEKWSAARDRWIEMGRPVHGEDQWDLFVRGLSRDD